MINKQMWRWLPIMLFFLLAVIFGRGLFLKPQDLPSVKINHQVPSFSLLDLSQSKQVDQTLFHGQWTLINVWASWCEACLLEHAWMKQLQQQGIRIIGLNYKDNLAAAKTWLANYGNPYELVLFDSKGSLAIDLGVYGSPETFLVDPQGVIRYRHVGILTETAWQQAFLPQINQ